MSNNTKDQDSVFMQAEEQHSGRIYPTPEIVINDPVEMNYDNVGTPGHQDHNVPTNPTLKELVLVEVRRLVAISSSHKEKIETAKTKPKKDFFLKKLRKNNDKLADMIIRLEQLNRVKDNDEPTIEEPKS